MERSWKAPPENTGIGLAHICNARGYPCVIYMPDNQSPEKVEILKTLGAEVRVVPTVPYRDEMNYQKQAGRFAASLDNAVWANQFDNTANRLAHYESTGPEILRQTGGRGGRLRVPPSALGARSPVVAAYLKEHKASVCERYWPTAWAAPSTATSRPARR